MIHQLMKNSYIPIYRQVSSCFISAMNLEINLLFIGAMYNADLQCRLQFNQTNDSIQVCSKLDEICSQLWCLVNDVCVTQLRPAAPGTNCGKHKVRLDPDFAVL